MMRQGQVETGARYQCLCPSYFAGNGGCCIDFAPLALRHLYSVRCLLFISLGHGVANVRIAMQNIRVIIELFSISTHTVLSRPLAHACRRSTQLLPLLLFSCSAVLLQIMSTCPSTGCIHSWPPLTLSLPKPTCKKISARRGVP
jgi:hypothetical protein